MAKELSSRNLGSFRITAIVRPSGGHIGLIVETLWLSDSRIVLM